MECTKRNLITCVSTFYATLSDHARFDHQPRSQGLSSFRPSERGREDERPWERGCLTIFQKLTQIIALEQKRSDRRSLSPVHGILWLLLVLYPIR